MPPVGLVRPVVAAGPLGEHRGERRGGPGMGRMYKRVNDFPIRKGCRPPRDQKRDRKSTRLNSSHTVISYAVFCLKKKKERATNAPRELLPRCVPTSTVGPSLSPACTPGE